MRERGRKGGSQVRERKERRRGAERILGEAREKDTTPESEGERKRDSLKRTREKQRK